jgi:hypothetical protein
MWNSEAYNKQILICRKLTDKGLLIAWNQEAGFTNEAREAYRDILTERGWVLFPSGEWRYQGA